MSRGDLARQIKAATATATATASTDAFLQSRAESPADRTAVRSAIQLMCLLTESLFTGLSPVIFMILYSSVRYVRIMDN